LSEEIKALLHVRNDGLRRRKFKTSFLQELRKRKTRKPQRLPVECQGVGTARSGTER
jgi:hypothetical protein